MIKLNRTTEYGLIALRHMSRKRLQEAQREQDAHGVMTSAREISDSYGLPFEITAKTLQRLKETGLIESVQGAKGGYLLQRSLNEVTLAEFIELMEGPQFLVACAGGSCECEYDPKCEIKGVLNRLNGRIFAFLSGIRLGELAETPNVVVIPDRSERVVGIAVGEEP
jgi:Rrf2 family protein